MDPKSREAKKRQESHVGYSFIQNNVCQQGFLQSLLRAKSYDQNNDLRLRTLANECLSSVSEPYVIQGFRYPPRHLGKDNVQPALSFQQYDGELRLLLNQS